MHARTLVDKRNFTSSTFTPGSVRVSKEHGNLFVVNRAENKLFTFKNGDRSLVFAPVASCEIVDFAVEDDVMGTENDYALAILSQCGESDFRVYDRSGALKSSLNEGDGTATSIEFCSPDLSYFVSTSSSPHLIKFDQEGGRIDDVPSLANQIGSNRMGIDLMQIRRDGNNLFYASERNYGLPIVFDETGQVLGQLGANFGSLADSFGLAFGKGAFGWYSTIVFTAEELQNNRGGIVELTAGVPYEFVVYLRNSNNTLLSTNARETVLKGIINGLVDVGVVESKNETHISVEVDDISWDGTHHRGSLKTELASANAGNTFEFGVWLRDLDLRLNGGLQFTVKAGPTSALFTRLDKQYVVFEATDGEGIFKIESFDAFGNKINVGGEVNRLDHYLSGVEDEEVSVLITDLNNDGSYFMQVDSKTSLASSFLLHVTFDGEEISNSPVSVTITSGDFDFDNTMQNVLTKQLYSCASEKKGEKRSDFENENVFPANPGNPPNSSSLLPSGMFVTTGVSIVPKDRHGNIYLLRRCNREMISPIEGCAEFNVTAVQSDGKEIDVFYSHKKDGSVCFSFERDQTDCPEEITLSISVGTRTKRVSFFADKRFSEERISASDSVVMMLMSFMGLIMCFFYLFLCFKWQNENAIKFSQKNLLFGILLGLMLQCVFLILLSLPGYEGTVR